MCTLERIKDCENVVAWDLEDTIGEKSETPRNTQDATQAHDGHYVFAVVTNLWIGCFDFLQTKEPDEYDDEGGEGKEEDQCIVADVDNIVGVIVCYPAPWNREASQLYLIS